MTDFMRMFPLGNVLFPHTLIPLRIFETRYLQMIAECEAEAAPFGVVLIERGFEVGGGDTRFQVGTAAAILETAELPGDHRAVIAAGRHRIEVVQWLPDDPYPAALVRSLETQDAAVEPYPDREDVADAEAVLRRALVLISEMGRNIGSMDFELSPDPEVAVYQMAGLAPVGALDAQHILEASTTRERLTRLRKALDDETELLRAKLGGF